MSAQPDSGGSDTVRAGENAVVLDATGSSLKDNLDADSLSQLFAELMATYETLDTGCCEDSAGAKSRRVERALELCGRAQAMAGLLGLFSSNEQLDEVSTEQLKYLLLPALAGYLWSQRGGGVAERPAHLQRCLGQYGDFLRLAGLYRVPGAPAIGEDEEAEKQLAALVSCEEPGNDNQAVEEKSSETTGAKTISRVQPNRATKIERFRRRKELERQLIELRPLAERPQVEEEDRRAFYLKLVERWVIVAAEEAAAAKDELPLARMMAGGFKLTENEDQDPFPHPPPHSHPQQRPPLRAGPVTGTFVLTRSALEARVFGAGYPSLPTYSVEEWVDEQIRSGNFPTAEEFGPLGQPVGGPTPESVAAERAARDAAEDADDPQERGRLRFWDDWKDHNRRGDGNRYRKG